MAEPLFRALVENALDLIVVLDHDGVVHYVSPSVERVLGHRRDALIGRTVYDYVHADDLARLRLALGRRGLSASAEGGGALEFRARHADGSWRVLEAVGRDLPPYAGLAGIVVNARDVTDRRRAEEEHTLLLREQVVRAESEAAQRRLAFLADASKQLSNTLDYEATLDRLANLVVPALADWCLVDMLDEDGGLCQVAVAHAEPEKEDVARDLRRRYPPTINAEHPILRVLRSGQPLLEEEIAADALRARARDAEHLALLDDLGVRSHMVVPLVGRERALGALSFIYGASGRHYTPADLRLAEELGRRAAQAIENARLYREAQEAIRVRDRFVAAASHDLKNPLMAILGLAQVLERRSRQADSFEPAWLRDRLGRIASAARRLNSMLDELLDVGALQSGRPLELVRREMDLADLARAVAVYYQQVSERHDVRVEGGGARGWWDAARLERVLHNLIANAVKYSPDGGEVTLLVDTAPRRGQPWARLRVRDQGVGIPQADLPRIFDGFYRGENVVGRFTGTGLGLAGVRQVVELHGGAVEVQSQQGEGSEFIVWLPLTEAEPAQGAGNR